MLLTLRARHLLMILSAVIFENLIVLKCLVTNFVGVRDFFSCMHARLMLSQSLLTDKCLATFNTQVVMRDYSIVGCNHVVFQSPLFKIFLV